MRIIISELAEKDERDPGNGNSDWIIFYHYALLRWPELNRAWHATAWLRGVQMLLRWRHYIVFAELKLLRLKIKMVCNESQKNATDQKLHHGPSSVVHPWSGFSVLAIASRAHAKKRAAWSAVDW